ncbi:hypothetical protein [Pseudomonas sp. NPDC089569]|uniref:hypothetical protein n=1 Tax=Pseudomonas sp. NPDC089569 TaxID=3390722 RepID=UPI003D05CF37
MSSWNNLKDAGRMLPAWFFPFLMSVGVIGLYVLARYTATDKPHELVAFASLTAIVLSLLAGFAFLVTAIVKAKPGNVLTAVGEGFHRGLTYVWVCSATSLFMYVCASPAYRLVSENIYNSLTVVVVAAVLGVAYWASGIRIKPEPMVDTITGLPSTALAPPKDFAPSVEQRPAFQVTMADQTRLLIHLAGRIVAYQGSNCIISGSFSAYLDLNARTGKIFSDMNLLSTKEMIYWRLHMLMMGTAAEQVIRGTSSDAAFDDLQNFDDLAVQYLALTGKGSFFRPVSEVEATMKANRLMMIRQSVLSRCAAAATQNKSLILDLIRLMRGRTTLLFEDIKHIIDRVELPSDFPRAEFDTNEVMERALLQLTHEAPETFDAESLEPIHLAPEAPTIPSNVSQFRHQSTQASLKA